MLKKSVAALLMLSMLIMLCPMNFVSAQTEPIKWCFDTDGNQEGWLPNKGTLSVAGGVMTHTIKAGNSNAFLLSPKDFTFDGSVYKYVKIRLKNNNCESSSCIVSFTTQSDGAWDTLYSSGTKSVMTPTGITGYDSDFKEYIIDMSGNEKWMNGVVTRFRLLTFHNAPSVTAGSMDIDYIELCTEADTEPEATPEPTDEPEVTAEPTDEPEVTAEPTKAPTVENALSWGFNTDGNLEDWRANKGTLSVSGGVMTHTINAGQNNAFLLSPDKLNFNGGDNRYVKIRLKNNNCESSSCIVSFTTQDDGDWDKLYSTGTKTVMTSEGITGYDEEFKEYVIDMSGCENWMNGTITRLRLLTFHNASSVTAGSMDIDYIEISNDTQTQQPTPEPTPEPTATPEPTPTPEPVISRVSVSAVGTEAAMVGAYVMLDVVAEEGYSKLELYNKDTLIYSGNTITKYPYELTYAGEYTFTAKAYYEDKTDVSEAIVLADVKAQRKEREYAKKYSFNSGAEGFIARSGYSSISNADGALAFEISNTQAYMYASGISFDLKKGDYIILRMKNETDASKMIFQWKTAEDNTFSEDKKITFDGEDTNGKTITTNDTEYKDYVFYMGDVPAWKDKTLTYLQIYPSSTANAGTVYIDELLFSDMAEDMGALPQVSISADCGEKIFVDDKITLEATVTAGNAQKVIFFNNEQKLGEFTAAPYKMEYAPTSAQSMQIYALAVDKYGTIVRSDNTVNTEVKNQYDISTPVLTETTDGIEISLNAVQNTDTQEAMILVAALYDAQGNMTALKTSAFAQDNSAKVDFSKEQYDKSEKALVTVIRSLTDAKCYTSAFTINF